MDNTHSNNRLGSAFHESFSLSIPSITQVLSVVAATGECNSLSKDTTLGSNYIRSMPRYCIGAGLLDSEYRFTKFGNAVLCNDPDLSSQSTLWLIHYNLSAVRGPGPEFWHYFVTKFLHPGRELTTGFVGNNIREHLRELGKDVVERTAKTAASVILSTYSKEDSLGPLGLLWKEKMGKYTTLSPRITPPLWVFAYALACHWAANWGDVTGVNLRRITDEGGLGSILGLGGGMINRYLGELQREGFVIVQRRSPPFQLTRNWNNSEGILERIYG